MDPVRTTKGRGQKRGGAKALLDGYVFAPKLYEHARLQSIVMGDECN